MPAGSDEEATAAPNAGTYTKTHAIAPLSLSMSFEQSREFTETAAGTRARVKDRLITGKSSASFSVETYLEVSSDDSAAAVRGPDVHNLLKAAIGASSEPDAPAIETEPVRNCKYEPATTGCLPSVNIVRTVPGVFSETVYGAMVDSFSISMSSGDPVTLSFSGQAYNHVQTGAFSAATADYSAMTGATPVVTNPKMDVYQVQPKTQDFADSTPGAASLWSWGEDREGDGGFGFQEFNKATSIDEGAGSFISNGHAPISLGPDLTGADTDATIVPFVPKGLSQFFTPKPISSTQGSVTITPLSATDGALSALPADFPLITNAPITSLEISIANNLAAIADQAFTSSDMAGAIPGYRDVTGTLSMRVKKEFQNIMLYRRDLFRRCSVTIILGNNQGGGVGRHVQIDMAYIEIEPSSIEVSGQDEMTVSMPFKSLVLDTTDAEVVKDFQMEWK